MFALYFHFGAFGSDVETLAGAHWIHQALK